MHYNLVHIFALTVACVGSVASSASEASPEPVVSLTEVLAARMIDGLTLSPDSRQIAFRVVSPIAEANRTQAQWYKAELGGDHGPIPLGRTQDPIWMPQFGMPEDPVAAWLPDEEHLAVLAQSQSTIAVRALGEAQFDVPLTSGLGDVRSFRVDADGRRLHYTTGADRTVIAARQHEETLRGVHLDQSVIADGLRLTENHLVGARTTTVRHEGGPVPVEANAGPDLEKVIPLPANLGTASFIPKSPNRPANLTLSIEQLQPSGFSFDPLPDGTRFRIRSVAPQDARSHVTKVEVSALMPDGGTRLCGAPFCQAASPSLRQAMVNARTGEVVVLANLDYSGHPKLFGWTPSTGRTRLIWQGDGSLTTGAVFGNKSCPVVDDQMICVFAAPTRPPELVTINLTSGKLVVLADPNAMLAARSFPTIHQMSWSTPGGVEVTGTFVDPIGHDRPSPLVITTYSCPGFLQGGTANVTPEFELARHGIASLCLNLTDAGMIALMHRDTLTPLQLHQYALGTLELVVQDLAARHLIDQSRVGISGQSFSSNVAAYAISHSHLFKAASLGTGITIDPNSYYITAPTRGSWRKLAFSSEGLPPPDDDPTHIWEHASPALNARSIDAALLIQSPESEYLFGLQLYTSVADAGGAVDMFIYPHGGHMLGEQPAQRLSRAFRSVAWFRYWLDGERDLPGLPANELAHWKDIERQRSPAKAAATVNAASSAAKPPRPAGA